MDATYIFDGVSTKLKLDLRLYTLHSSGGFMSMQHFGGGNAKAVSRLFFRERTKIYLKTKFIIFKKYNLQKNVYFNSWQN